MAERDPLANLIGTVISGTILFVVVRAIKQRARKIRLASAAKGVGKRGVTPLMFAARAGNTSDVLKILSSGAGLNAQDDDGFTALMHACDEGDREMVKTLLEFGAKTDLHTKDGLSITDIAKRNSDIDALNLLEQHQVEQARRAERIEHA